jgi:lipoprotein-anchoring transpeptidase ErfK/SrfK
LAQQAAEWMPDREDAWLILAALVEPQSSMEYIQKALDANPTSVRARRGMDWARKRMEAGQPVSDTRPEPVHSLRDNVFDQESAIPHMPWASSGRSPARRPRRRRGPKYLAPILLALSGCVIFGFAAWSAVTSPVLASLLRINASPQSEQTGAPSFAKVVIPKPVSALDEPEVIILATPTQMSLEAAAGVTEPTAAGELNTDLSPQMQVVPTISAEPSGDLVSPTPNSLSLPADQNEPPIDTPTPAGPTETPGAMVAQIVPDTPTPEYVPPTESAPAPVKPAQASSGGGGHWIDVDLSQQRLYAYEGDTIVNSFLVSTGTWQTPTVTGKYKVWIKLRYSDMTGPGYYLPDVPYVMYFYGDYGLHGTYWHNNFGTPMSHGCVNLSIPDAAWIYDFSAVGTTVNVHY